MVVCPCVNHCPSQAVEMVNDMLEAQEEPLIETEHVMEDIRRQSGECLTGLRSSVTFEIVFANFITYTIFWFLQPLTPAH